jgi:hypothetical protein
MNPFGPDDDDSIGAIGKCVGKGFFDTSGMTREFLSCIRAMRADYCGLGLSLTRMGTPIAIYDMTALPLRSQVCRLGECFEASWTPDGANCINHARYEHLVRLSTSQDAAKRNPDGGVDPGQEKRTVVDGFRVCSYEYQPLADCVAKYTDFYFDDTHQISSGATPVNPVEAVSAQYVCWQGEHRPAAPVRTRTQVRFVPIGGGPAETLDCCDTLGCK